jgi:4-amino-4-deoxy-L-arabinose transferase-like glycosyltransferase
MSQQRCLLVALSLFALGLLLTLLGGRIAAYRLHLAVDAPVAPRTLQQFEPVERVNGTAYTWSRPRAALALFGLEGRALLLDMRLTSPRPAGVAPAELQLAEGEHRYGAFPVLGDWRRYRVLLPHKAGNERTVSLVSNEFAAPGRDGRVLGVALSQLRLHALVPANGMPGLERALYLAAWPALLFMALYPTQKRRLHNALLAVCLGLVALAAANPLASSYYLPTVWPLLLVPLAPRLPALLRRAAAMLRLRNATAAALPLGLGLAVGGQALLRLGQPPVFGGTLLLGGALLAASALSTPVAVPGRREAQRTGALGRGELLAVLLITLGALVLRLWQLDRLPLGLFRDEARHGSLALRIWNDPSFRPVYVVFGAQLPALLFYLQAPVVGLLGPAPWTARLVPTLAGALTPLALWWFVRPIWGPRVALIAAGTFAVAAWSLAMSRWAFPVSLDPLLVLVALGALWRALAQKQRLLFYGLLAGVCGGLAVYTYHTGRFAPPLLVLVAVVLLGSSRARWRAALPALAVAALAGLLVLVPLLSFVASDPGGYMQRVERVNLFKDRLVAPHAPVSVIWSNIERYLLMWHVAGDPNARHNVPGAPMLDPFSGVLLLLGLALVLRRPRRTPTRLLLVWLAVAVLPGVFSGQAPHAMRAFGTLVPACILAGVGLCALLERLKKAVPRAVWQPAPALLAVLALGALAWNSAQYFGAFAQSRAVYTRFNVAETTIARELRRLSAQQEALDGVALLVPDRLIRRDVFEFAAHGLAVGACKEGSCPLGPVGALLLLDAEDSPAEQAESLRALGPGAALLGPGPRYPRSQQPVYLVYGVGKAAKSVYELLLAPSTSR